MTDLLLAQMEDVIYEGIGTRQLPFAPYICLLLRRASVMTEKEYAALPETTTSFSPAEPSNFRVLQVLASQSTQGGEETTAPEEVDTEAPEGAQPGARSTEALGQAETPTSRATLDPTLAARLDVIQVAEQAEQRREEQDERIRRERVEFEERI